VTHIDKKARAVPARPTIVDVAARSGVSTATVSRVLSGAAVARPATRARVLAAVDALDYRPSGVARALKRAETRTIGLLVTDIGNPFFPQVVRAVEDEAHASGFGVLLCNASDDPARELAYLDLLLERRVDGLIVASARTMRQHAPHAS
jgi:LacI family transcriptional regulator